MYWPKEVEEVKDKSEIEDDIVVVGGCGAEVSTVEVVWLLEYGDVA